MGDKVVVISATDTEAEVVRRLFPKMRFENDDAAVKYLKMLASARGSIEVTVLDEPKASKSSPGTEVFRVCVRVDGGSVSIVMFHGFPSVPVEIIREEGLEWLPESESGRLMIPSSLLSTWVAPLWMPAALWMMGKGKEKEKEIEEDVETGMAGSEKGGSEKAVLRKAGSKRRLPKGSSMTSSSGDRASPKRSRGGGSSSSLSSSDSNEVLDTDAEVLDADRLEIRGVLSSRGGEAVLYRARFEGTDYALKVFRGDEAGARERAMGEFLTAKTLQRKLSSTDRVRVLAIQSRVEWAGEGLPAPPPVPSGSPATLSRFGLLMDLHPTNLNQYLFSNTKLDLRTRLGLFRRCARAVQVFHQATGAAHNDVKLENFLYDPESGTVTLADLPTNLYVPTGGDDSLWGPGTSVTVAYMRTDLDRLGDPQHIRRVDSPALARVGWEIITGNIPWCEGYESAIPPEDITDPRERREWLGRYRGPFPWDEAEQHTWISIPSSSQDIRERITAILRWANTPAAGSEATRAQLAGTQDAGQIAALLQDLLNRLKSD